MSDNQGDIIERIHSAYHTLTAAERKVADHVIATDNQVQFMSITQLAEECGVADATITRFCRTMGLKGFNAFKIELARRSASAVPVEVPHLSTDTPEGRQEEVCRTAIDAVHHTMELISPQKIQQAVNCFGSASRVLCFGSGGSMIIANTCAQLFSTITNKFCAIEDSHNQLSAVANMTKDDVLVLFSYSGATTIGIEILELAKSRGITTILVTRFVKSPAANLADIVLCCGVNEAPFQLGSVPAKIAQLVVMDLLYHEYRYRNQESCEQHIQNIAAALSNSHM